jgi:RNA polymerase sigma-70 factor (ECF subfamily)
MSWADVTHPRHVVGGRGALLKDGTPSTANSAIFLERQQRRSIGAIGMVFAQWGVMTRRDPAASPTDAVGSSPPSRVISSKRSESGDDPTTAASQLDQAMNRYADGDEGAFAELFLGLGPRLRGFLRRLSGSADVADDLLQETFLRLHAARGGFARGRPVLPWAYAIARNCYVSRARSARVRLEQAATGEAALEKAAGPGTQEQEGIARQMAEAVDRALQGMTAARREAFVMLRYEGLSVALAAQIAGVSEGALKIRAFHAYEIIRAALAEQAAPQTPAPENAGSSSNDGRTAAYGL